MINKIKIGKKLIMLLAFIVSLVLAGPSFAEDVPADPIKKDLLIFGMFLKLLMN